MAGVVELWEKQVENCQTKIARDHVQGIFGTMKRCYCISCGKAGGAVTPGVHVVYVCPKCAEVGDAALGLPDITDLLVQADVYIPPPGE